MNFAATIQRRQRLHDVYGDHSGLVDASRLAHLNGPAVRFSHDDLAQIWSAAPAQIGDTEVRSHLYLHVPFCKSICSFCNYDRLRPSSVEELTHYTEQVCLQIEAIAPHVAHLGFSSIYFGGGTPSVLTAAQLDTIMSALDTHMVFHPSNGRNMEYDPAVINAEKLAVARAHGFNRFSFGIQTLDSEVNVSHNRGAQSREIVAKRFAELNAAGVDDASCDILLGLAGTTPAQMLTEIEEIVREYRPGRMHIFMVTPTDAYVDSHFDGDRDRFWAHLKTFEDAVPAALPAIAEACGYNHSGGSGHQFRLIRKGLGGANQSEQRSYVPMSHVQRTPVHVLGFGPSARSSVFGAVQYQNFRDHDAWYAKGCRIAPRDEARIHLCNELRDTDIIESDLFQQLHQTDFASRFPLAHHVWTSQGLLAEDGVTLKPQSRLERTRALMWLVEEEKIEQEVARHFGLPIEEEGLRWLLAPLTPGQELPGGAHFTDVEGTEILLSVQDTTHRFRMVPGWSEQEGPRFVATAAIPESHQGPLKQAIAVLRKLSRRNLAQRHDLGSK